MLFLDYISKTYNENEITVSALNDINLKISERELICIFGESGSGKTTLLNLIGGLDVPTRGAIYFENKNLKNLTDDELACYRNNSIGFVFQDFCLIDHLSVEENIAIPLVINNKSTTRKETIDELMHEIGIYKRKTFMPSRISGGEKQRTAIARALINNPKILLADEPTGNLDQITGKSILSLLKTIQKEYKISIIIATHDETALKIADRVIELKDGRINSKFKIQNDN